MIHVRTFSLSQRETLHPLLIIFQFLSPSAPTLALSIQWSTLSLSLDLPILDISVKWNHTLCSPLWAASFTGHVFRGHLCYSMDHYVIFWLPSNILLRGCIVFHLSIHLWVDRWLLGRQHLWVDRQWLLPLCSSHGNSCTSFCMDMFLFHWIHAQGGHAGPYSHDTEPFQECKVVAPFYISSSNVWGL